MTQEQQVHLVVVQFEDIDSGYTWWSQPTPEADARALITSTTETGFYEVVDYDAAAVCQCTECLTNRAKFDAMIAASRPR